MKIGVASIVKDHYRTLVSPASLWSSVGDIMLFCGIPIIISLFGYEKGFKLDKDGYSISITFFGIFIALLLNIQVAVFSIFQRKWTEPADKREARAQKQTVATRRALLEELNANISYLVLVCCAALVITLLCYLLKIDSRSASAGTITIYAHFLLTLLMVVKRAHALFQTEYRESPD
jgi:drug/metabolite transporter (DMT)-like permease